ncbi:hypothetical protein MB02_00660 [Croceicoccus estronivorus]|uniref:hypothetical protein n=1 Tax=Croceicoccus estronivorus TaxID=1172626 RepID=UPI00083037D5|nr:hypothetical protein [Croceicoccus estronivorus]OCC25233.1 hypothetical protein MB02_00660 [Croceicoccus estronivorus]
MTARFRLLALGLCATVALAGCRSKGDIVVEEGVGITALRTVCPAVGVPDYTGDITLFNSQERTASALAVTAAITNVRVACDDSGSDIYSVATFDVVARRYNTQGPATVTLPYFSTVVRGDSAIVSKRIGTVTLNFAPGQERTQTTGQAGAYINRAEATLPDDIRERITRRRKSGEADAAVDPLTEPDVKAAVARASFELLVGFQLTKDQLAYNVTR